MLHIVGSGMPVFPEFVSTIEHCSSGPETWMHWLTLDEITAVVVNPPGLEVTTMVVVNVVVTMRVVVSSTVLVGGPPFR
jgi:hypothetical protein